MINEFNVIYSCRRASFLVVSIPCILVATQTSRHFSGLVGTCSLLPAQRALLFILAPHSRASCLIQNGTTFLTWKPTPPSGSFKCFCIPQCGKEWRGIMCTVAVCVCVFVYRRWSGMAGSLLLTEWVQIGSYFKYERECPHVTMTDWPTTPPPPPPSQALVEGE